MEYKIFDEKMSSMLDKVGEAGDLILDDVASFLSDNQKMNEELVSKDEEISRLKNLNSKLQQVNSNLLLQIPVKKEETETEDEKEKIKTKTSSMKEAFDEYGNFKR